jgi:transporter family protein
MRQTAFALALVATVSWGLWVVFARLAGETLTGETIVVITYLVGGAVGVGALLLRGTVPTLSSTATTYAVASGLFFGIGGLAYYAAIRRGTTATATTVAAMYFVVASLLAFVFLGEPLRVRDGIGIGLGVGAVLLLAT